MGGCATNEISWDNTAIDVSDGRLKLMVSHYFSPRVQGIEYKSPYSVLHKYHMNYLYGYCEIRAKMPFEKGLWPSFWGLSACNLSGVDGGKTKDYGVEVDIFEIFGTEESVVPNIHKWYRPDYDYNKTHNAPKDADKNHTQYPADLRLTWEWSEHGGNLDTLDNEYHLYGYEWTPTGGSMYVDGEKYITFDYSKSYDLNGNMNHFRDPMYFIFNMHVLVEGGGMEVNYIDDNKDVLPAEYAIDWYRVYQKKDGKSKIWTVDEPYTLVEYKGRDNPWKAE
jgi:beta-glucanase (GH16 family)